MDVNLITPATENLLVTSLRSAITEVNGGAAPNDALTKQAVENALGPELACRLVEAFNTSKTLNKLRNCEGEKRAESFDLADRDAVLAGMYPSGITEKAASVLGADPRTVNFNTKPQEHHEKTAAAGMKGLGRMGGTAEGPGGKCVCPSCGATATHATGTPCADIKCPKCDVPMTREKTAAAGKLSLNTEYTKTALYGIEGNAIIAGRSFLNSIKNARDDLRMTTKRAKEDVAQSLHAFVSAFKRADRSDLSPLKDVEERLSYHFGPVAKMAMDLAWNQLPEKMQLREKRAEEVPTSYVYPLKDELYKLGEQLITDLQDAGDMQADFLKFEKKAVLVEAHFKGQVDLLAGKVSKHGVEVSSVLTEKNASSVLSKKSDTAETGEAMNDPYDFDPADAASDDTTYDDGYGNAPTKGIVPTANNYDGMDPRKLRPVLSTFLDIEDAEPVKVRSIFPAEHEGKLRSIKVKLMLNDMLSNDPVISAYPVEQVTQAYNRVAEMVPALATQPIAMRGLLANMLQREGGLEAMEVKNLLDTEESKRKLRVLGS